MADWRFRLGDLVETTTAGRPAEKAYSAMAALLVERFLRLTGRERAKQVHLGPACRPICGLCTDIALRHSQWATNKLIGHAQNGVPQSAGVPVRDWVTILSWTAGEHRHLEIDTVRDALNRWLPQGHRLLPIVLALSTQLLPASNDARAPRRLRDYVGDPRKSILAQRQGWRVKPDRDLQQHGMFRAVRERHPRGMELLVEVVKKLEHGDSEPYETVLGCPDARQGDRTALRAAIADLLSDQPTRDWFMLNVDARHSYNQDLRRRADRYVADINLLAVDAADVHGGSEHTPHHDHEPADDGEQSEDTAD